MHSLITENDLHELWASCTVYSRCIFLRCVLSSGFLTGGHVLRLFHGHMDECLAIATPEEGEEKRRQGEAEQISLAACLDVHLMSCDWACLCPDTATGWLTMKEALCAVRLGPCGGWSLSGSGDSPVKTFTLNIRFAADFLHLSAYVEYFLFSCFSFFVSQKSLLDVFNTSHLYSASSWNKTAAVVSLLLTDFLKTEARIAFLISDSSWSGSHMKWGQSFRIRHITTGRYLCLDEEKGLLVVDPERANTKLSAFCFRISKVRINIVYECPQNLHAGPDKVVHQDFFCYIARPTFFQLMLAP